MNKFIFLFLLCVFIDGLIKHLPLFDDFIEGVKDALQLCRTLFTTFMALMVFVQLLQSSGTIDLLSHLFSPLLSFLHIPIDIIVLGLLRPVSANASLTYLYSFYETFGVDHPLSLLATLIQSGSDTTFYVVTIYFSSIHMKKTRYALLIGLTMDCLSVVFAIMIYLKMFV